ncbi:MAG: GNAT family N-acetyltransferase [Caldilineaceae bacterium]|nr:GNAT family N-acetyltransferase [Caldilineaceae bacterium]
MQATRAAWSRQAKPIQQHLADGLVLRNVRDEEDIARCAAFVSVNVREISGITTERVLHHFPTLHLEDFLFVEDERTGEVVSTTCLIPWQCRFGKVMLNVAMLEVVATHPAYRKRGLVRAQISAFHDAVAAQHFDLSIIEGIPYYYRQFGYTYATAHAASDTLLTNRVPDEAVQRPTVYLRPATPQDIPDLVQFYDASMSALDIATVRTPEIWHYVLTAAQQPVYMIEGTEDNQVAGYISAWRLPDGRGIRIAESGIPSAEVAFALLRHCKQTTTGEIQIAWPQESTLVQVGRGLGSTVTPSDQWLMRINHVQDLLSKLSPLLEERLAQSACARFTGDVTINLFRQAYLLRFAEGRLLEIKSLGFVDASMGADGGDLCIPPDAFVRLLLGWRTLSELRDAWPDIVIRPARRYLLETLFPKCRAYFSMPYFYFGKMERAFQ